MSRPLLSLSAISYRIGEKSILQSLDFSLYEKEIVTIVGPNGAGKSTLLSIALGLIQPSSGQVKQYRLDGQALSIGYVPQSVNRDTTLPITVMEFMCLSKNQVQKSTIKALLAELGLSHLITTFLCHLSGGELRRVLFARALLNRPHLLVLDEPTAGVDIAGQKAFYQQLNALRERYHFTILMVSHDLHLVMSATDRVICLNGHICCQGKPSQVISNPQYQALFGDGIINNQHSTELAFYQHQHNHTHR